MAFDYQAWLNRFPGTNFHELNIDWLIDQVKALGAEVQNWELVNEISYQGAWDITKQYPAWSIVTVNDTIGYIAIKLVPAGVNYTNSDYWVLVADFTAQLAGIGSRVSILESEMDKAQADINSLKSWKDRRVLWVGDSYGNGWDGSQSITDPYTIASGYLGCSFVNISHGGCRFGVAGTDPQYKYRTYIQNYISTHTDLDTFTDVIIIGGANDIIFNPSDDISTEFSTTINLVKANFPNAKIRVGMVARLSQTGYSNCTFTNMRNTRNKYRSNAINNGVEYIATSDLINHNYNLLASDGIHLSDYHDMGLKLAQLLLNGEFERDWKFTPHTVPITTTASDDLAPSICEIYDTLYNGSLIQYRVRDLQFAFTPDQTITWGKAYKFAKVSGDVNTRGGVSATSEDVAIQVTANIKHTWNGNSYYEVQPVIIQLYNNYLYITFKGITMNGGQLNPAISEINIRGGFTIDIDENNC